MGYGSTSKFIEYMGFFDKQGVPRNASILTLGDQTVRIGNAKALDSIETFLNHYASYDRKKYEPLVGQRIHVRSVWEDAGFDYESADLNQVDGSIPIDLNVWPNDALPQRQYDVVTNEGTTEHVTNQTNAFAIVHYMTRPGGIMIHEIPVLHFAAHAMVAVTPLFLKKLIDANGYEVIHAKLRMHDVASALAFHHDPGFEFLEGFTDVMERSTMAAMAYLVLKKPDDAAFVPPLDVALDSRDAWEIVDRYIGAYGGPATPEQVERARKRLRDGTTSVTDRIAARIDDGVKRFDRSRHGSTGKESTSPAPMPPGFHATVTGPGDITVFHRFTFSLRKAFIALSVLVMAAIAFAAIVFTLLAAWVR